MTCDEARTLLATRRQLVFAQERAVQAHLASCSRCATVWQREERIMQQFRAIPSPTRELSEHTKRTLRSALTAQRAPRRQLRSPSLFAGVVITLLLLVSLFRPPVWQTIVQTIGVGGRVAPSSPGTLYIASSVPGANAQEIVGARVTAVDLATWHERYRVEGADEATLAPDGARLYVAGRLPGAGERDTLRALDPQTGRELWRIPIQYRAGYPGQSNLVVSPDGRWLYLRSYDGARRSGDAATVPFWLQIVDTTTGTALPTTIPLPFIGECGAPTLASPPVGHAIYVSCYGGNILAINTRTQEIEPLLPDGVDGTILLPNMHEMYAVNGTLRLSVLDSTRRTVLRQTTMRPTPPFSASQGLVALSGDGQRLVAVQTLQERAGTDTASDIRVFDTSTGKEVGRFRYEQPLHSFVVGLSGTTLYAVIGAALATDTTIVSFDLPSGVVRAERSRPQEDITQMFFGR